MPTSDPTRALSERIAEAAYAVCDASCTDCPCPMRVAAIGRVLAEYTSAEGPFWVAQVPPLDVAKLIENEGREHERAAVVAHLRLQEKACAGDTEAEAYYGAAADEIEAGEHVPAATGGE